MRMLDVQADAMRLNADVQSDFVLFIQDFIDRWATCAEALHAFVFVEGEGGNLPIPGIAFVKPGEVTNTSMCFAVS